MNRQFDLLGKRQHPAKTGVTDRVRGMRRQTEGQQRLVQALVARSKSLGKIIVRVGRVTARKIDRDQPDRGANSGGQRGIRGGAGKEVHIVEAGDATAQHLGAGEQRAVMDELLGHVLRLGRPDVLL